MLPSAPWLAMVGPRKSGNSRWRPLLKTCPVASSAQVGMTARPQVTVYTKEGEKAGEVALPAVFTVRPHLEPWEAGRCVTGVWARMLGDRQAPIRPDLVKFVFTGLNKNKRQPYAVSEKAGHQVSPFPSFALPLEGEQLHGPHYETVQYSA
jgi:hypothetical protein